MAKRLSGMTSGLPSAVTSPLTRIVGIVICALTLGLVGCASMESKPVAQIDIFHAGLDPVDSEKFDVVFVRPGVDFSAYTGLLIDPPELAFQTPDRSQRQFPLTEAQKIKFRAVLAAKFAAELGSTSELELAGAPAPDVLRLKIRVSDISATVRQEGIGNAGRAAIALKSEGEGTLLLELRDSQSEQTLARAADARGVEGVAILQPDGAVTSWNEVEKICERWASAARKGLDALIAAN